MPKVLENIQLGFTACRIGMRKAMKSLQSVFDIHFHEIPTCYQWYISGRGDYSKHGSQQQCCWQWLRCYRPIIIVRDQYQILCLGLTGAGKSTALATLVGEPTENIEPTTGFNIKTLPLKDTVLDIKELGGSENIRPFWNRYFHGLHGLLYVVNAAQEDSEMENAVDGLQTVLSDSSLKGIPCLILATHEDVMGAWTQEQIEQVFQPILHGRKWKVQLCGLQDRNSIQQACEILIDLMSGID